MKNYYFYIVNTLTALLLSVNLYATHTNTERLTLLRPLIEYDMDFNAGVTIDSVIVWEKLLEPELLEQRKYDLLFQIKMRAVQSLIIQGNISLAINNANLMYQKAKELDHPLGIALALRAMGNAYLSSSSYQAGIDSYEDAIKMMMENHIANTYIASTLSRLIFTKLRFNKTKEALHDLRLLESLYQKTTKPITPYYLVSCKAYYFIKDGNLAKAREYLQQMEALCKEHPFPYYISVTQFLVSTLHIESKEYDSALKEHDELIRNSNKIGPYRYAQVMQEHAEILALMGKSQEACAAYDSINAYKDSLDAQSYLRQINELHTIYKIDQSEINNINRQKKLLYWSIVIILITLILIISFIFRIKQENKRLLKSQREQEKAKIQAENSIRTKSLFLSNMSHEIRTPLNALSGFSSILTEASIDNETRNQCNEIIQQNSELLLKLINDVIDLSSLEIGKMEFKFKRYDAIGICKNVIDMLEKIKQTQAEVRFITSISSLELMTDNARLQQVLINLLINATKFTPQGSITLELIKQSEDIALFSVTDTGCGIPKEKQMKTFNRFEKLNENAQGTGLGLSICQLIIEQLGGEIWIDPNYAEGARFMFTHPIHSEEEERKEDTK